MKLIVIVTFFKIKKLIISKSYIYLKEYVFPLKKSRLFGLLFPLTTLVLLWFSLNKLVSFLGQYFNTKTHGPELEPNRTELDHGRHVETSRNRWNLKPRRKKATHRKISMYIERELHYIHAVTSRERKRR